MFFANAGGALPNFEEETRQAGTKALKAASEFWQMVSDLEKTEDPIDVGISSDRIAQCASGLRSAANTYANLPRIMPMDRRLVTEFDLEVAAVGAPSPSGRWKS